MASPMDNELRRNCSGKNVSFRGVVFYYSRSDKKQMVDQLQHILPSITLTLRQLSGSVIEGNLAPITVHY